MEDVALLEPWNLLCVWSLVQVLHTISLNGSLEVRKQLADTKHLKLLEKVYMSFENGLPAAAVCQMLIDWAFMFRWDLLWFTVEPVWDTSVAAHLLIVSF